MLQRGSFSLCGNKCQTISCSNNLKQLGLAYQVWAGDNDGKFPMAVSVANGGALESTALATL